MNEQIVQVLRLMLADAQAGNLQGMMAIVFNEAGCPGIIKQGRFNVADAVLALDSLKLPLVLSVLEKAGPPPPQEEPSRIVVPTPKVPPGGFRGN